MNRIIVTYYIKIPIKIIMSKKSKIKSHVHQIHIAHGGKNNFTHSNGITIILVLCNFVRLDIKNVKSGDFVQSGKNEYFRTWTLYPSVKVIIVAFYGFIQSILSYPLKITPLVPK